MSYYAPIVAGLVTALLTSTIFLGKFGKKILDVPCERSLHSVPIPRIGGIAMMAGILSAWSLMLTSLIWWLVLPMIGVFMVSLFDDIYSLSVKQRLLVHFAGATVLVVCSGLFARQGLLIALVILFLTVWMTNLFNFMDGSDGLAGGMALFGFTFYGIVALLAHDDTLAMMNLAVGAAALGFLYKNFYPAKIFMGDAGSIPLGFLAAGMGLLGWKLEYWPAWFPILIFSPFIVDASVTLIKRTLRGAEITAPHREHYYQRAIRMGSGHRKVALIVYLLMLATGMSALWLLKQTSPWLMLLAWCIIYGLLILVLETHWKNLSERLGE